MQIGSLDTRGSIILQLVNGNIFNIYKFEQGFQISGMPT